MRCWAPDAIVLLPAPGTKTAELAAPSTFPDEIGVPLAFAFGHDVATIRYVDLPVGEGEGEGDDDARVGVNVGVNINTHTQALDALLDDVLAYARERGRALYIVTGTGTPLPAALTAYFETARSSTWRRWALSKSMCRSLNRPTTIFRAPSSAASLVSKFIAWSRGTPWRAPTHPPTMPTPAVIIPSWNGADFLTPCLRALLNQDAPLAVTVVDNASTDDSVAIVRDLMRGLMWDEPERITLIENGYNLGFAGGCNVGLRHALASDADMFVLLNQDTVVQPGWAQAIIDTFAEREHTGVVGCQILAPDGTLQHAGAALDPATALSTPLTDPALADEPRVLHGLEYVTGAAFAIQRRVVEKIGGLAEEFYPAYYEETDYCWRARRAGFEVVYQPLAVALHAEAQRLDPHGFARLATVHRHRLLFVLRHWDAAALRALFAHEQQALASATWLDDAVARGQAAWHNLLRLPDLVAARRDDDALGEPLTAGEVRWLLDTLPALRELSQRRARALLADAAAPPTGNAAPTLDLRREWTQPVAQSLSALIGALEQNHALREHDFVAHSPLAGRLRAAWANVAARWLVRPIVEQQTALNAQMAQALREVQRHIEEQAQRQRADAALLAADAAVDNAAVNNAAVNTVRAQLDL